MSDTTYNGWTNYATWRINLEVFDGIDIQDFGMVDDAEPNIYDISESLKDYAEEIIFSGHRYDERAPTNLMEDYARAFLQEVNWYEIAKHLIEDHIAENQE